MSTTAERLAAELGRLAPAELEEVWQRFGIPPAAAQQERTSDERANLEAIHALYGRFAGGSLMTRLLQERSRDRAREDEQLRRLGPGRNG